MDFAIFIAILLLGLGMTALGLEMTLKPPTNETKWWYRGAYIFCGLAFLSVSIWQFHRADSDAKKRDKDHQEELIRNEGNVKYMQGELDTMNRLLGNLASNSDPKQTAQLLQGLLSTRSTLKKDTFAICSEMEQWIKDRLKTHPAPTQADPTKQTPKEFEAQNAYWQSFNADYYTRFGPRVLAIVQQYGAKGVDVKMIEQQAGYGYMPQNIMIQLRAFAGRLDDNGNLKN